MKNFRLVLLLIAGAVLLTACSTATRHIIKTENQDPNWKGESLKNILIVGIYKDRAFRISSESVFAAELSEKAVASSPSYDLISDLGILEDEGAIHNALEGKDFDAIMTIATIKASKEFDYEGWQAQYNLFRLLGTDRGSNWTQIASQLDYYESGKFVLDIGLWDAKTLNPIWNATTNSYSQEKTTEQIKKLSDFMIETLNNRGFI